MNEYNVMTALYNDVLRTHLYYKASSSFFYRFPIGHPDVLRERDIDIDNFDQYFGLCKLIIRPPRQMHIPVLPFKTRTKLMFALCRRCGEDMIPKTCQCSDEERCWLATAHTNEIQLALKHGYEIVRCIELLHFPPERTLQFDKEKGVKSLFSDYIDCWLRVKQESSGYPPGCDTAVQKAGYIERYKDEEDIELRAEKIEHNPGLRFLSKQMLNRLVLAIF